MCESCMVSIKSGNSDFPQKVRECRLKSGKVFESSKFLKKYEISIDFKHFGFYKDGKSKKSRWRVRKNRKMYGKSQG